MPENKAARATDLAFAQDRAAAFPNMADRPALRRFVERPPAPQPGGEGYAEFAKQVLTTAFYRDEVHIQDTLGERALLAWRITREMGRHMGVLTSGEALADALCPTTDNLDPWTIPHGIPSPLPGTPFAKDITSTGDPHLVKRMMDFDSIVPLEDRVSKISGLPILPPIDKNIGTSPLYLEWLYAAEKVSTLLGLSAGTPSYPAVAENALPQLLFENQKAWPSRSQIVAFEEIIISEVLELFVERSLRGVQQELFIRYGLLPHEAKGMVEMARYSAMSLMNFDIDEARSLMTLRLESFIERSRKSFDLRAELSGMKQMAIIQGLARTEAGDLITDFTDVVRSVSSAANPSITAKRISG